MIFIINIINIKMHNSIKAQKTKSELKSIKLRGKCIFKITKLDKKSIFL